MTLYMEVTADKHELPIAVSSQIYYLARMIGKSTRRVSEELSRIRNGRVDRNGRLRGYVLMEVEVEDDD